VYAVALENFTAAAIGSQLVCKTAAIGAATTATRLTLDATAAAFTVPIKLTSYTVAQLNALADSAGLYAYCTDESGGAVPAFNDGTDWRRVTDREIVTTTPGFGLQNHLAMQVFG
jgi:hypothetical protein